MRCPDPYGWMVSDTVIIIFISIFSQLGQNLMVQKSKCTKYIIQKKSTSLC